jgi:hypothetical protein
MTLFAFNPQKFFAHSLDAIQFTEKWSVPSLYKFLSIPRFFAKILLTSFSICENIISDKLIIFPFFRPA